MAAIRAAGVRWWPALLLLSASGGAFAWAWLREEATRQNRVTASIAVAIFGCLGLLLWLLFLSRLSGRRRWLAFFALLGLGAAAVALLEIRGVTGDLVPIVGWRWGQGPAVSSGPGGPVGGTASSAADFPQFLGPHRDARVPGTRLVRDWQNYPPREVWRRAVGAGWSGFAVVGGRALTQEQRGDQEWVVAYSLATGENLWSFADDAAYESAIAGTGPRATPTVVGGRVFTMGSTGRLNALDLESGEPLWSHDLVEELQAQIPEWGKSASPLVVGEAVIVTAAGGPGDNALVAFDARSGDLLWHAGREFPSYSSPLVTTLAGVEHIVVFNQQSVSGHALEDGQELWKIPWSALHPNVAQPLPLGEDRLLVSSGYGIGARLLHFRRDVGGRLVPEQIWESPRLKLKFTQAVEYRGFLYGLDDGVLVCLDPATGERCWKKGRYGHGQVLLAGDLLLLQSEGGELILLDPDPEEHRELHRLEVLEGRAWNSMALAGRFLILRNDREAVCYELAVEEGWLPAPRAAEVALGK